MRSALPAVPSAGDRRGGDPGRDDTLRSGWLTTGPRVKRFEADFAAFLGARHAIAVNSCTAALHLALEAARHRPGDEVIMPTHTFTATAEVRVLPGRAPVLVDIDPHTLNIDPDAVEAAITPRTKAIVPVHFGGLPCDMARILAIAQNARLARGRGRGARAARRMRGALGRHARRSGDAFQLLRQQDHHDRRGRHGHDRRRRARRAHPHDAPARHEPRRLDRFTANGSGTTRSWRRASSTT